MIELKNVVLSYGQKQVLKDINLTLADTGLTSIIGPNGSGKSSCLSLMSRLQKPSAGEVLLDNCPIQQIPANQLAKKLSILRQDNHTNARIQVKDLITFGRYPYHQGRPTAEDLEIVEQCIEYVDLQTVQDRFIDQLSGGQRQRVFIAMVLAQDTQTILLDEPLNNLDIKHSVSIMKQLRQACDELNKQVVVVLHDINFAAHYSDTIIALKNGELVANGSPTDIMQDSILSHIYDMPMTVTQIQGKPTCLFYS